MAIYHNKQKGLTVLELIIALALGVVLVGGISQVYLENKKNYVQDEAMARLQENGRFAINVFKRELKMAGFFGVGADLQALSIPGVSTGCAAAGDWALSLDPIDFVNDSGQTASSSVRGVSLGDECVEADAVLPGTDILVVKRVADRETINNNSWAAGLSDAGGDEKKERYYLKIKIHPVNGSNELTKYVYVDSGGFASADADPSSASDEDILSSSNNVSMWLVMNRIFYVRNYSVTPGDGIPTLVMATLTDKQFEQQALIEGVEAFHIEFGIPDSDDFEKGGRRPVNFVTAPTADDLDQVTVARVYLLLRNREPLNGYTDTKTYKLGASGVIDPADKRYMRRVFTTTVGLRNIVFEDE